MAWNNDDLFSLQFCGLTIWAVLRWVVLLVLTHPWLYNQMQGQLETDWYSIASAKTAPL